MTDIKDSEVGAGQPAWLPESARRVLIASASDSGEWGAVAAVEVAEMIGRHRPRTVLVSVVAGASSPGSMLRPGDGPGIVDIVAGQCRVSEAAFTPRDRSFLIIPAGRSAPQVVDLWDAPAFRHLVTAAGRGGTLLLHLAEADLAHLSRVPGAWEGLGFHGLVLVGGASAPRRLPAGVRLLARVEAEATRPPSSGFTRPSATPPITAGGSPRGRPRGRVERIVDEIRRRATARGAGGVAAVWLAAALAVWLVWQGLSGWPAFQDDFDAPVDSRIAVPVASAEPEAEETGRPNPATEPELSGESPTPTIAPDSAPVLGPGAPSAAGAADAAEARVVLPYSVLVASVPGYADAERARDHLVRRGSFAFIALTHVAKGDYYRVFAGAVEDREQAREIMVGLVERGDKTRERDWDVRQVALAYNLRDFESESEAEAERERLHDVGVPAYVLRVGETTGAIYRLYCGAFESEDAAAPTDRLLTDAGIAATLVTRRGEPR